MQVFWEQGASTTSCFQMVESNFFKENFYKTIIVLKQEVKYLDPEEIRKKYIERLIREKQTYISSVTGIPAPVLSEFKAGRKTLYPESLAALNDYLINN